MKAVESSERSIVTMKSSRGLPSALAEGRLRTRSSQSGTVSTCNSPFFQPAQIGAAVENRAELVGIALIKAIEIVFDHGFDGRSVSAHGFSPGKQKIVSWELSHERAGRAIEKSRTLASLRPNAFFREVTARRGLLPGT